MESSTKKRSPRFAAIIWILIAICLLVSYGPYFMGMWGRWFPSWHSSHLSLADRIMEGESYYTHGPLVPIISMFIILLLVRFTKVPTKPARIFGSFVLIGGLLLHVASSYARVNFASGFSLIFVLIGLVLLLWGFGAMRRLWFPILLLCFMIPMPEVTINNVNFELKMLATRAGVFLADLAGISVFRNGNVVYLDDGLGVKKLAVENVCNGLRTLISLLAFGAIYAYVCKLRGLWRIFLLAMTIPVALASNSLRILTLI
ncbi:MAG TPA: exosortase, partial [Phycisphaerae bacterium]|nr:exosortase [Phycisphaerae bacterium]